MPKQIYPPIKKDLYTVRQYTIDGINVWVSIDRVREKAGLVEPDGQGGYKHKKWDFTGREVGYMRTWLRIFGAMTEAVQDAIDDLQETSNLKAQEQADRVKDMVMAEIPDIPEFGALPGDVIGDDGAYEKLCKHNVGHPYPLQRGGGLHTCDGCCAKKGFFN